jgi:hypothetical protein
MLERLEQEGLIGPPPPYIDPFAAAFQNMSFRTPVPLAPQPALPGLYLVFLYLFMFSHMSNASRHPKLPL